VWRCPAHACRCAPPTVAGESGNDSTQCGSGRQPSIQACSLTGARLPLCWRIRERPACGMAAVGNPTPYLSVQTRTIAGARLPLSRASSEMALRGVVATGSPPLRLGARLPPIRAGQQVLRQRFSRRKLSSDQCGPATRNSLKASL
jgi:hypothetical protein